VHSDPWLTQSFSVKGQGHLPSGNEKTCVGRMASPASSDEGEIRDGGVEKATTTLPQFDGTSVDRQDRNRSSNSNSMSPEHGYRSKDRRSTERSRSPYDRQPRGSKRGRDEDYSDRSRGDPRRFKVHYEDAPQAYKRRSRVSYEDIDQGSNPTSELRYDDRERYSQKRARTRSRSPYRSSRGGDRNGHGGQMRRDGNRPNGHLDSGRPNFYGRGDPKSRDQKDQSVSKREQSPLPADNSRHEAKIMQGSSQQSTDHSVKSLEPER
jgi:serine/threonine-protein kinase PRP4